MSREQEFRKLVEDFGVVKIAKSIVADGNGPHGTALTEAEFTKMVRDHAQQDRRSGETSEQAFTRVFNDKGPDGLALRKAHAIVKNFPNVMRTEPMQVGGRAATDVNDPADALAQLNKLAEEQRRRSPELTIEQAFARVYAATENAELVARERKQNRPVGHVVGAAASI